MGLIRKILLRKELTLTNMPERCPKPQDVRICLQ